MSVRQGIVALLAERPMHGYQLKTEFERRTGGTWPVNIGQVYTTVQRLIRDGLVEPVPHPGERELERFRLTEAGAAEAAAWWSRPVERGAPAREELAIKLALAVTARGVDVRAVVQAQRTETMRALHDYTRLKATGRPDGEPEADLAWSLVLDHLVFAAEAEVRWLDHVEARVARAAVRPAAVDPAPAAENAAQPGGVASAQGADATRGARR
ncbi:PadR family transcriptional regulator [Cellulomonas sp. KRMCY2]|uniref:PadR family transcriptional regulator n=1 Tax=Cellulomonas sp. KRMCY2 TaxID=1304865 RepID=UPI00045EB20B|nr:PadR family transcriptional regulator [Cellulomonas sp. KRMCY2]